MRERASNFNCAHIVDQNNTRAVSVTLSVYTLVLYYYDLYFSTCTHRSYSRFYRENREDYITCRRNYDIIVLRCDRLYSHNDIPQYFYAILRTLLLIIIIMPNECWSVRQLQCKLTDSRSWKRRRVVLKKKKTNEKKEIENHCDWKFYAISALIKIASLFTSCCFYPSCFCVFSNDT